MLPRGSLSGVRNGLPFSPCGETLSVGSTRHRNRLRAKHETKRWILGSHDFKNGIRRRLRLAAFGVLKTTDNPLPKVSVDVHSLRHFQRLGATEISGVGPGLEHRNLNAESFDLFRQAFMESFDCPFRGTVEADERHRRNRQTTGNSEDVSAALLP